MLPLFKTYNILILGIIISSLLLAKNAFLSHPNANASDLTLENILSSVNQERVANNLPALNSDTRLGNAAQFKAGDMQNRHYFSHTDPEGNYIWNKIVSEGYTPYLQLGENLAIEFHSTESLISAWMNSPTHRANILTPQFKDQGMGLQFGQADQGQYGSAVANTFGTLLPAKKPTPTPPTPAPIKKSTTKLKTPSKKTVVKKKTPPPPLSAQTPEINLNNNPEIVEEIKPPNVNPLSEPPRGDKFAQNFSLPQTPLSETEINEQPETNQNDNLSENLPTSAPITAVVRATNFLNAFTKNPVLILAVLLLLFLLIDLNKSVKEKLSHLDKKINNTVLLILSILCVIFLYWF